MQTITLPFRKRINPALKDDQVAASPIGGRITAIEMHFPGGTNNLVEVRVVSYGFGKSYQKLFPSLENNFIALDAETLEAEGLDIPISPGENLGVEWYNYDGKFSHEVPVIIRITG